MSETLYDKAFYNYNVAVMIYNSMGNDEAYLNYIGYHLQQSVELAMKYLLENKAIAVPKTHDIDQLIRFANINKIDLLVTDYVKEHSEMFSMWEAKTRYVLDYRLELDKIEAAMKGVSEYLDKIEEKEHEDIEKKEDKDVDKEDDERDEPQSDSDSPDYANALFEQVLVGPTPESLGMGRASERDNFDKSDDIDIGDD